MLTVEESYNPDRTRLSLKFEKKQAKKTSEENYKAISDFLQKNSLSKTKDIAEAIGLSTSRTRAIS